MTAPRTLALTAATVASLAAAAVLGTPRTAETYPFGTPAGFAGDQYDPPPDGDGIRTCAACHNSYPLNSGTGSVSISVPGTVAPGQTVPVTISVNNTTEPDSGSVVRQGFQAVARFPGEGGAVAGTATITDAATTWFAFGSAEPDAYVTHTTTGTSQTSWTYDWTAPSTPGEVVIYAVGNAGNGGDGPGGDYIYTTTQTVQVGTTSTEAELDAAREVELSAPHPNPVRTGLAVVRLTLARTEAVRVQVVDGRGRVVREVASGLRTAGETDVTVRTDGLRAGLYFVVAQTDSGRAVQPVSVVR